MCEVAPGRKRSFDDILMMIEWIEAHRLDESEVDNYEPYDVFRNRRLSENARLSPGEVQAEFLAMVEDSDIPCKYARNQWLVPHFVGVEVKKVKSIGVQFSTKVSANITNDEQQRKIARVGQSALSDFSSSIKEAGRPILAPDYPAEGVHSDQPSAPPLFDSVAPTVGREVYR
jgi:hypothetical protein